MLTLLPHYVIHIMGEVLIAIKGYISVCIALAISFAWIKKDGNATCKKARTSLRLNKVKS